MDVSGDEHPNRLITGNVGIDVNLLFVGLGDLCRDDAHQVLVGHAGNGHRSQFWDEDISLGIHRRIDLQFEGTPNFQIDDITDGDLVGRVEVGLCLLA